MSGANFPPTAVSCERCPEVIARPWHIPVFGWSLQRTWEASDLFEDLCVGCEADVQSAIDAEAQHETRAEFT